MKSNEYNNVVVKNENNTYTSEFTNAQKTEYSFQKENSTTSKDELNDRKIINDNPEENVLKFTKVKERKREDAEQISKSTSTGAEATATSAATASSAAGTVGGVAVSVATAAVVVIGAVAGISIIEEQKEQEDLITFVSSDISSDSISFVFRMPASLLAYDEAQTSDSYKVIVGQLRNSDGFYSEQEFGFENIDEYVVEGYGYFDGLTANTGYALTITMFDYIYTDTQEVVENPTELAFRSFTTLPSKDVIKFNYPFEITDNSVSFSFDVALKDLGYDPENPSMPSLYALLNDDNSLTLTEYSFIDDNNVTVYGIYSRLDPETTYSLKIYLELDGETKLLGSTSFTTLERTSSIVFEDVVVERDYVSFTFTVAKSDVDYNPETTPAVQYEVRNSSDYYDSSWAEEFEEVDDNTLRGYGSFSGLPLNYSYDLVISLSREREFITLGETTFDTYSGFQWVIDPTKQVDETSTFYNFAIKASYIGFISEEETQDVINQISAVVEDKTGATVGTYQPSAISMYDSTYCTCIGNIDGLTAETDYVLNIYYQPDNEDPELLGSCAFTTTPSRTGFAFNEITPGDSYVNLTFEINSSEVEISDDSSNIVARIEFGATIVDTITITDWNTLSDTKLTANVFVDNLASNTEFYVGICNAYSGEMYGGTTFTTEQSTFGFQITDMQPTSNSISVEFYVNAQAFDIDWSDQSAVASLENKLYVRCYDETGSAHDSVYASGLTQTSSDVAEGTFTVNGLSPSSKYIATVFFNNDTSELKFNMFEFATKAGVSDVQASANNSFYVVEDNDGYYKMPIQFFYTGDSSEFGANFIINLYTEGLVDPVVATAQVIEGYQYALFSELTISRYFGNTMTFKITCEADTETVLYEDAATIVDVSSLGTNSIYGVSDMTTELSNGDPVNFSFSMVCALGDKSSSASIVFAKSNGSEWEYEIDISQYYYSGLLTVNLLQTIDSGGVSLTYDLLKDMWDNQELSVYIRYYPSSTTGDSSEFHVTDTFTFNFLN